MKSVWAALPLAVAGLSAQEPRISERVEVARVIVDVRVLDDTNSPVLGLEATDFEVKIDGHRARVESALWVNGEQSESPVPSAETRQVAGSAESMPAGGLVVFLFQKNMEASRITGLMRMLIETCDFLDVLMPHQHVAVLSFDSHLNVWTDFTTDRNRLLPILTRGVLLEHPPPVQRSEGISLLAKLSPEEARRAYSVEKSLKLIADALKPLPGAKSIVLVGYGFGRFSRSGVTMEADYEPAVRALLAARASVFSLDVTQADYHSLEAGLQLVSGQTGGFFLRTHVFPTLAMKRLAGVLAGDYVLFVEKPPGERTWHDLDVRLTARKGQVFARAGYEDR